MRRPVALVTTGIAVVLLGGACGGSGTKPASGAPSPNRVTPTMATAPATPVASSAPTDPRGYTDADIIKTVTVSEPNVYGDYGWSDNSPDFNLNADNGVGFKFWGCKKAPGEVFNNVVFRIEVGVNGDNGYLDGHDQNDRNPVEVTTPTGQGYIHIWGSGPEGTSHYPVSVTSEGQCQFRLDFVSRGSGNAASLGTKVFEQSGRGNDNVDTPSLKAPWYLAWQYTCPTASGFVIADDQLGGGHIVQTNGTGDNGVFEQGVSAGQRTLSIVTGDQCQWHLAIYQK